MRSGCSGKVLSDKSIIPNSNSQHLEESKHQSRNKQPRRRACFESLEFGNCVEVDGWGLEFLVNSFRSVQADCFRFT
jgi:hypothetical protein